MSMTLEVTSTNQTSFAKTPNKLFCMALSFPESYDATNVQPYLNQP